MRIRKAKLDPQDPRWLLLAAVAATLAGLALQVPLLAALGAGTAGYLLGHAEHLLTRTGRPQGRSRAGQSAPPPDAAELEDAPLAPDVFEQQLAVSGWPRSPDG